MLVTMVEDITSLPYPLRQCAGAANGNLAEDI